MTAAPVPPVFVLSSPRAGSTLVRYLLDTHRDLCCPPEIHLGNLCHDLRQTLDGTLGATFPAERRDLAVLHEVRRVVEGLMERYAEAKGKRGWCDKSPQNLERMDILPLVFPEARWICLHRNCMDFVHSALEASRFLFPWGFVRPYLEREDHNRVAGLARFWTDATTRLLDFEEEHDARCFRLTYEELVFRTEETLEALFGFLGLPHEPGLAERAFVVSHDSGSGDSKIRFTRKIETSSVGRGSSIPVALLGTELLERVNRVLERAGYAILDERFSELPSPYRPDGEVPAAAEVAPATPVGEASPEPGDGAVRSAFEGWIRDRLESHGTWFEDNPATYRFVLDDVPGAGYLLDPAHPEGLRAGAGDYPSADCVVTLSSDVLRRILDGALNPQEAFLYGDIRVSGDEQTALKLSLLL